MLRPYLHTCGCPSPLPAGSPLQCKQHAWVSARVLFSPSTPPLLPAQAKPLKEFTNHRITLSNTRYTTAIARIDAMLNRKRGDLQRLRDDVKEMKQGSSGEWNKEIEGLEKEVRWLGEAREEAEGLMQSYEIFAKGEYWGLGWGVWKEGGP